MCQERPSCIRSPVRLGGVSSGVLDRLGSLHIAGLRAACGPQQGQHHLAHVPVEDVALVGPLGQVKGCGGRKRMQSQAVHNLQLITAVLNKICRFYK